MLRIDGALGGHHRRDPGGGRHPLRAVVEVARGHGVLDVDRLTVGAARVVPAGRRRVLDRRRDRALADPHAPLAAAVGVPGRARPRPDAAVEGGGDRERVQLLLGVVRVRRGLDLLVERVGHRLAALAGGLGEAVRADPDRPGGRAQEQVRVPVPVPVRAVASGGATGAAAAGWTGAGAGAWATGVLAGRPLASARVRLIVAVVDRPVPALLRGVTRKA